MSTNQEINSELPLNEFKKQLPKKKYNDILKLRLLESQFDNTMDQYKRTFQNYLSYTKQQISYEWRDRYPVQVSNLNAMIDKNFAGNVTKNECFENCAADDNCKYVLWSNSGSGSGFNCATNKCKQYTTAGGSMISSSGITESNPWCEDYFIAEEAAALATFGPFGAIAALFGLEEEFPMETNYKYHGWEKPEWKKYSNTSTQNARWEGNDWVSLLQADTPDACNKHSADNEQGPFDWTLHSGKQCSAHKLGGKTVGGNITSSGITLSRPPGGQTGMLVASRKSTIVQLKQLNSLLLRLMNEIYTLINKIYPKGIEFDKSSKYELKRIFKKSKRLKADRDKITTLEHNLSDLDGQNESLQLKHDANQLLYLGMSVILVGLAGLTYKFVSSKSE